jgi:hypothetical protein
MSGYAVPVPLVAGGNILPSTFFKLDTANDATGLQCGLNDPVFGIAQVGTHDAPGLAGSTAYAFTAGLSIQYFMQGDYCELASNPSGNGWTAGDFLKSDSLGYGTTGSPGVDNIGARAAETVQAGQIGRVQVTILAKSITGTFETVVTADTTLTAGNAGSIFAMNSAATHKFVLPPVATLSVGDWFQFTQLQVPGSGAGLLIDINPADDASVTMYGDGFTPAAGKGAVNTQATGAVGDTGFVIFDGTNWQFYTIQGTWAREA